METQPIELWRPRRVMAAMGLSRTGLREQRVRGLLPKAILLDKKGRAIVWPSDEIAAVIKARIAGAGEEELRALVAQLEAKRTSKAAA